MGLIFLGKSSVLIPSRYRLDSAWSSALSKKTSALLTRTSQFNTRFTTELRSSLLEHFQKSYSRSLRRHSGACLLEYQNTLRTCAPRS